MTEWPTPTFVYVAKKHCANLRLVKLDGVHLATKHTSAAGCAWQYLISDLRAGTPNMFPSQTAVNSMIRRIRNIYGHCLEYSVTALIHVVNLFQSA